MDDVEAALTKEAAQRLGQQRRDRVQRRRAVPEQRHRRAHTDDLVAVRQDRPGIVDDRRRAQQPPGHDRNLVAPALQTAGLRVHYLADPTELRQAVIGDDGDAHRAHHRRELVHLPSRVWLQRCPGMTAAALVAIGLLVLINAFFVAVEFALVSTRTARLPQTRAGQRARAQVERLDEYLAACQLGITIASLALGAPGEPTIARLLEPALGGSARGVRTSAASSTADTPVDSARRPSSSPRCSGSIAHISHTAPAICVPTGVSDALLTTAVRREKRGLTDLRYAPVHAVRLAW